ncbi:hypothetical protein LINPERPRIM_LOCUS8748, partial [Linum perenne]
SESPSPSFFLSVFVSSFIILSRRPIWEKYMHMKTRREDGVVGFEEPMKKGLELVRSLSGEGRVSQ